MLPEIKRRYTDTVLQQVLAYIGQDPADCTPLDGFEAHVFRLPGEILKITHTLRRSSDALCGELELVAHLAAHGVPTPPPVPMPSGELVLSLPDGEGGAFLAYRFQEARGRQTRYADWTPALIEAWGAVTGRINRVARDFVPSSPKRARWHWDQAVSVDAIPAEYAAIRQGAQALLERLRRLPQTPTTYSLIHSDLHHGNFFWEEAEGRLSPFDFDDCHHGFTASELAVPLYYAVGTASREEPPPVREEFAEHFLVHFLRGYQTEDGLQRAQVEQLQDFLLLRTLVLAEIICTRELADRDAAWRDEVTALFHRRLAEGEPVVALDLPRLARQLVR